MRVTEYVLSPPALSELVQLLEPALRSTYKNVSVEVVECPDLRGKPFSFPLPGLCGSERIADFGGQGHLFPRPLLDKTYALSDCAQVMKILPSQGLIIGAGASPSLSLGRNAEMALCFGWQENLQHPVNMTRASTVHDESTQGPPKVECQITPLAECGLMANLYGCHGETGPVLKINVRGRKYGVGSFTEDIRRILEAQYGKSSQISLGGVFLMKTGKARYHIMPDFPSDESLPFKSTDQLEQWLTYHNFDGPMVCLTTLHSADPHAIGVRLEHTHCFSPDRNEGGHYHFDVADVEGGEEVEYEGYFNTAKVFFQVDYPQT